VILRDGRTVGADYQGVVKLSMESGSEIIISDVLARYRERVITNSFGELSQQLYRSETEGPGARLYRC
jgi:hypothetical protein